jgi:fibro-slime domain-containing protein
VNAQLCPKFPDLRASLRRRRLAAAALLFAVAGLGLLASCGARTGLEPGTEPCSEEGETRVCEDACGGGAQICEGGAWGECQVPKVSRACTNRCGSGTESCENGDWGSCDVPPSEEPCSGVCGAGTRTCENGVLGECVVPVTERRCENLCGSGVQRCENGVFGACEVPVVQRDCQSVCGKGHETCTGGAWQACDAPLPRPPKLQVVIRDFKIEHPDFERPDSVNMVETGIVDAVLGPDDKPIYRGDPLTGTRTTTGENAFYQWYNDVDGVNLSAGLALELQVSPAEPGLFVYEDRSFFPIDDQLFGNEGNQHNFHFTLEAKTTFQYIGGEVFRFIGDDDMWVFINRRLAIDLGGLHTPRPSSVDLDFIAAGHGLLIGEVYPLHFFFAERHTIESNFTIETSIAEPGSCD